MGIIYGVHQPRYVSDSNIARYADKIDLEGDIYRLKNYAEGNHGKYRYLGNRLPETLIFNSKGMITKLDIDCSSDLYANANLAISAIDSLETGEQSLQNFIVNCYVIDPSNTQKLTTFNTPVYVIKFAEFVGKLNKDNIPKQIKILKDRPDVKYILLNMDYTVPE